MVCGRCGTPLQGVQQRGRGPLRLASPRSRWRWWLIGVLVLATLGAVIEPGSQQPRFRDAPSDRAHDWWQ